MRVLVLVAQVDWMLSTELFIDLFFICDIILNFNTGYVADQVPNIHLVLATSP